MQTIDEIIDEMYKRRAFTTLVDTTKTEEIQFGYDKVFLTNHIIKTLAENDMITSIEDLSHLSLRERRTLLATLARVHVKHSYIEGTKCFVCNEAGHTAEFCMNARKRALAEARMSDDFEDFNDYVQWKNAKTKLEWDVHYDILVKHGDNLFFSGKYAYVARTDLGGRGPQTIIEVYLVEEDGRLKLGSTLKKERRCVPAEKFLKLTCKHPNATISHGYLSCRDCDYREYIVGKQEKAGQCSRCPRSSMLVKGMCIICASEKCQTPGCPNSRGQGNFQGDHCLSCLWQAY